MNLRSFALLLMVLLPLNACTAPEKLLDQSGVTIDVSPKTDHVVFSAKGKGEADLYLFFPDSMRVKSITESSEYEQDPAFSPDGKRLVYVASNSESTYIYTCPVDGGERRQLTQGHSIFDSQPFYSRDGKHIVFARAGLRRPYSMGGWTLDNWDIFMVNSDGTNLRRITRGNFRSVYSPQFSFDKKYVIFGAKAAYSVDPNVFRVDIHGKTLPKPITTDNHSSDPSYSPTGNKITFISDRNIQFNYEVWTMDANGKNQYQVTQNASYNQMPRYNFDGSSILFLRDAKRDRRRELWKVNADGTGSRLIADSSLFDSPLTWQTTNAPSTPK